MAVAALTADQCKIGRAALGLDQSALAAAAGVAAQDVEDLEQGATLLPGLALKIETALAESGVTFHAKPGEATRMRVLTLDGIIEAPVTMRS